MRPKYDLDGITEGKRNSKAYKKSNVPGPGHYNPLDNTHGPRYTISAKYRSNRKKGDNTYNVPGVGSYNLLYPQKKIEQIKVPFLNGAKKWSNKNYIKNNKLSINVGPGTYEQRSFFDWNKKSFNVQYKLK